MPTGRLTRNTQRQLIVTSKPPNTGPHTADRAPTADHPRAALVREATGTLAINSAREVGSWAAAPAAWTMRATTSTPRFGATAQPTEASVNRAMPARKTRRCPMRSPSRPAGMSRAASVTA